MIATVASAMALSAATLLGRPRVRECMFIELVLFSHFSRLQTVAEPLGVLDREPVVVVVEVGVHIAAVVEPLSHPGGRAPQAPAGVLAPILAVLGVGAVEAHIGPIGR